MWRGGGGEIGDEMTVAMETSSAVEELFETGFVPVLDPDVYHSVDAASATILKILKDETPADLRWVLDHGTVPSEAMKRGDATHAVCLEHARFKSMYVVSTRCEAIQGNGERCASAGQVRIDGKWFCGREAHHKNGTPDTDLETITQDQFDTIISMRDALRGHKEAREIIDSPGWNECSLFWIDPETGERVKTRIDMLRMWNGKMVRVDLKTTRNAAPDKRGFWAEAARLGQPLQAAINLEGIHRVKNVVDVQAINIAVECKPNRPAKVCIHEFPSDWLQDAWDEYRELIERYHELRQSGEAWPGYPSGIQMMERPEWDCDVPEDDGIQVGGTTLKL